MVCRLFGTKPFFKPVLGYCQKNLGEILIKIQKLFIHENTSENNTYEDGMRDKQAALATSLFVQCRPQSNNTITC